MGGKMPPMLGLLNYINIITRNWDARTTAIRAIGYVAAYADATSSVPDTLIRVPRAGVEVIPPVSDPRLLRRLSFSTYFAKRKPITMGVMVISAP